MYFTIHQHFNSYSDKKNPLIAYIFNTNSHLNKKVHRIVLI